MNFWAKKKNTKYRNVRIEFMGFKFDSKKEAKRYNDLYLLSLAGKISDLTRQVSIELLPDFTDAGGKKHKGISYKADFSYSQDGKRIIEDVKSPITRKIRTYINKKKQILEKISRENLPWDFREV